MVVILKISQNEFPHRLVGRGCNANTDATHDSNTAVLSDSEEVLPTQGALHRSVGVQMPCDKDVTSCVTSCCLEHNHT